MLTYHTARHVVHLEDSRASVGGEVYPRAVLVTATHPQEQRGFKQVAARRTRDISMVLVQGRGARRGSNTRPLGR